MANQPPAKRIGTTCSVCHGTGKRFIEGHTFNPSLGRPLALVTCEHLVPGAEVYHG